MYFSPSTSNSSLVNGITFAIEKLLVRSIGDMGEGERKRGKRNDRGWLRGEITRAKEEERERKRRFDLILVRTYAETWRENHRGWISFLWI